MGIPINKTELYRMRYPARTKLRLKSDIQDPFTPIIAGDVLTVDCVDDAGQIHDFRDIAELTNFDYNVIYDEVLKYYKHNKKSILN